MLNNDKGYDMNDVAEFDIKFVPTHITRDQLADLESRMRAAALAGDQYHVGDYFPLTHRFAEGIYIREIRVPTGNVVITKLFKQEHATFLLQGQCIIVTEDGRRVVTAPDSWITPAGTKRLIYVAEDCIWTTVHANPNDERNVDEIEKFVIAESYDELEAPKKTLIEGGLI
jgi:hypothetical protein